MFYDVNIACYQRPTSGIKGGKAFSGGLSPFFFPFVSSSCSLLAGPSSFSFLLFFLSPRFRTSSAVTPLPTEYERLMKFILIYFSS